MFRNLLWLTLIVLLALVIAEPLLAQDSSWPLHPDVGRAGMHSIDRGPGSYVSIVKIILLWLLFLFWVATTGWVNHDCQTARMPYALWIPIVCFPFLGCFFLLTLQIPVFFLGYFLLIVSVAAPLGVYIWQRNQKVEPHQRVLTPDHLRHFLSQRAAKVGVQISGEKQAAHEKGPPVELTAMGGASDMENNANLLLARQSPGFVVAKEILSEAVGRRSDRIMLDYTREAVAVRYQIDGVWHDSEPRDRESGDVMLAVFKKLGNLNPEERRARQEGKFGAGYEGRTYTPAIVCQGTQTGERAIVSLAGDKLVITQLADTGMRDKMQEQLKEILAQENGFVLLSAMPGGGLSTALHGALRATDRLMRDFVAVEDEADKEQEVENVEITTYNAAGGETPDSVLPKLIRKEPNVIVCRDLPNAETVRILGQEASDNRLIVSTIRAKEAVEALLRVLMLKVPAAEFAPVVTAVLNVRLLRKLCDECKQPYTPPPDMLKKLGLPPERIKAFYRPPVPQEGEKMEICGACGGIGYHGRTGIYEMLVVNDHLRNALVKQPKLEILRQIARKTGHRSLQDEGLLLVVRGVTSLPELKRVLSQ